MTTSDENFRLFLALAITSEIKTEIAKTQADLRHNLSDAKIRWSGSEQWHLTLRFLGNVDVSRLDLLKQKITSVCRTSNSLLLHAEGIGVFPPKRPPRVIWVGVRDVDGQLKKLQAELQAATNEFTSEPPEETFTAHVTLGRVKTISRAEAEFLSSRLPQLRERHFGEWTAKTVDLMRSELGSEGARHTVLVAIPLAVPTLS
jgi:2'-5' RNA ligase